MCLRANLGSLRRCTYKFLKYHTRLVRLEATRVVVAGLVELAEAVSAAGGQAHADGHAVVELVRPSSLPDEGPGGDDEQLSGQEHGGGDYQSCHVDAQPGLVGDEDGLAVDGLVSVALEPELVGDLDGLHEQEVVLGGGGAAATAAAVGHDGAQVAGGLLLVTLDGLAGGHARGDERAELDHLGRGELEGVEVRQKYLQQR